MANKVAPKISSPGSIRMPQGGHNTNVGKHGGGGALAKVSVPSPSADNGIPNPDRKPNSGLRNQRIGQPNPDTSAAATRKPNRKGGAAFYGEM